jgi:5-methylcytosine-specific restriction endonuclease McrA
VRSRETASGTGTTQYDAAARVRRRLTFRFDDDGSLAGTFRLPPLDGAVLLQALRAAAELDRPGHDGVPAETPADARTPGHPADPARCHVQDGPAISITTAQMITCTAALSWMLHDRDGTILDLGRRRRRPTSAQRRAARERDHGRCRYPGCESRRTDLHHIQYWANGGKTSLDNMISLCKAHHMLVHDRGYLIAPGPGGGTATFYQPDGTLLPASPALPAIDEGRTIADCHDADITPDTIIPAWYGERLDLDYAIYTSFANADYHARHPSQDHPQDQHAQATPPAPEAEAEPWRPQVTEVDLINGISRLFEKHDLN